LKGRSKKGAMKCARPHKKKVKECHMRAEGKKICNGAELGCSGLLTSSGTDKKKSSGELYSAI